MGNEQSQLPGIEIEEKAIEISDFWSQHSANILNSDKVTNLSVFIGDLFVNGFPWTSQTPLERNSKSLMVYRHPCIIKYISSWQKSSKFYLAVEEVTPLSHVLASLNTLQICIGLHSLLKALNFLHEKGFASHNNLCLTSIYVTKDANWKLGGMEYLCRYKDFSRDYLNKCKMTRYAKAIDPNEDKLFENETGRKDFVDIYAFGVLACDILKSKSDDEIPSLSAFRDYCKNDLQNPNLMQRPKLSAILEHSFFNHDFLAIHSFLVELPLKLDDEKSKFFQNLPEKLLNFDETLIANQLSGLLLSRMVLLNKCAQENLVPLLLTPQVVDRQPNGLFSEDTFKKCISPKLLEIMSVRDAQIRLLLLNYFSNFMHTFSKEELQSYILPELLVGIKDTNDHLVSVTLRALADLVSVLGAATVVGGKRAKLFNDGRPMLHTNKKSRSLKHRGSIATAPPVLEILHDNINLGTDPNNITSLPERPRPDGEEVETSTEEIEQSVDEDLDNWEDWDVHENNHILNSREITIEHLDEDTELSESITDLSLQNVVLGENTSTENNPLQKNLTPKVIQDISELDIKNQLNNDQNEDFDFFQDMEPVIDTTNKYLIKESKCDVISDIDSEVSSKLAVNVNNINEDEGWGNGDWE